MRGGEEEEQVVWLDTRKRNVCSMASSAARAVVPYERVGASEREYRIPAGLVLLHLARPWEALLRELWFLLTLFGF